MSQGQKIKHWTFSVWGIRTAVPHLRPGLHGGFIQFHSVSSLDDLQAERQRGKQISAWLWGICRYSLSLEDQQPQPNYTCTDSELQFNLVGHGSLTIQVALLPQSSSRSVVPVQPGRSKLKSVGQTNCKTCQQTSHGG